MIDKKLLGIGDWELRIGNWELRIGKVLLNRVHLENCSSFSMKRKNPHPPAPSPKFGRRRAGKKSLSLLGRGI